MSIPSTFPSAKARLDYFRERLATDPRWALRALDVIASRQTDNEVLLQATHEDNGVGFTGVDAAILTSFHKQVKAWEATTIKKYASPLSPKQLEILCKRMKKYAGQIIDHMGSKAPSIVKPLTVAA